MPTEITQKDSPDSEVTILRVSGEMTERDSLILESVADDIKETRGREIVIDLSDLDLLDSEAAPALRRLDERSGVTIEGIDEFIQASIDQAERRG